MSGVSAWKRWAPAASLWQRPLSSLQSGVGAQVHAHLLPLALNWHLLQSLVYALTLLNCNSSFLVFRDEEVGAEGVTCCTDTPGLWASSLGRIKSLLSFQEAGSSGSRPRLGGKASRPRVHV